MKKTSLLIILVLIGSLSSPLIKIVLAAPAVSWVLMPSSGSTKYVTVGETFTLSFYAKNVGDSSPDGYVTIVTDSPNLQIISWASSAYSTLNIYKPGDYVWYANKEHKPYYAYLLDAHEDLYFGDTVGADVSFNATKPGTYYIYWRAAFAYDSQYSNWARSPTYGTKDPLGYYAYYMKIVVNSPKVDLTVRLHNARGVNNNHLPGAGGIIKVVLYDDNWNYITSKSVPFSGGESYKLVTFTNLDPNKYYRIEVYGDPKPSYLPTEFWGGKRIYIGSSSKTEDFYRNMPYFGTVRVNGQVIPAQMYVGDSATVKAEIRNPSESKATYNTKIEVYLDRNRASSYDYHSYGTKYVPSGDSKEITLKSFTPKYSGTYYARAVVYTYINNKWVVTDNFDWSKGVDAVTVGFSKMPEHSYELFVNDTMRLRFKIEHGKYLRFITPENLLRIDSIYKNGQRIATTCYTYKSDRTYWICDMMVDSNDVIDVTIKGISTGTEYFNYQLAKDSSDLSYTPISSSSGKLFADYITIKVIKEKILAEGTTVIPVVPVSIIYDPPGDHSFAKLSESQSYQTFFSLDLKTSVGVETEVAAKAGYGVLSGEVGASASLEVDVANKKEYKITITNTTSTTSSRESDDPEYIGPGKGDTVIALGMEIHYWVVETKDGRKIFRYKPTKITGTYYGSCESILSDPTVPNEVKTTLRNFYEQMRQIAEKQQAQLLTFNGEIEHQRSIKKEIEISRQGEVSVEIGINAETAAALGIPKVTQIKAKLRIGASIETTMEMGTSQTITNEASFTLYDDEPQDKITFYVYKHPVFGTFYFKVIKEDSHTMRPHEYNTEHTDGLPPEITNISPVGDVNIQNEQALVVSATVRDIGQYAPSGIDYIELKILNSQGAVIKTISKKCDGIECSIELPISTMSDIHYNEDYTIKVYAKDRDGQETSKTKHFKIIDSKKPLIQNVEYSPNPVEIGQSLGITALVSDNAGIQKVTLKYSFDGRIYKQAKMSLISGTNLEGSWYVEIQIPDEPSLQFIYINVTAGDYAENTAYYPLKIPVSTMLPQIDIQPEQLNVTLGPNSTVSKTLTIQETSGKSEINNLQLTPTVRWIRVVPQVVSLAPGQSKSVTVIINSTRLSQGEHEGSVELQCENGFTGTTQIVVYATIVEKDSPPQIKIISPKNNQSFIKGDIIVVKVDASDDKGIKKVIFYLDNNTKISEVTELPYKATVDTSNLQANMYHTIRAVALDTANQMADDFVKVYIKGELEEGTNFVLQAERVITPVNRTSEVHIRIGNSSTALGSLQFDIVFDPAIISIEGITTGPAAKNAILSPNIKENKLTVGLISAQGLENGTIIVLKVRGLQEGTSAIHLIIADATDRKGNKVKGIVKNGQVTVKLHMKGDASGDGRITAADALIYLRFAVGLDISPYHLDPKVDDLTGDGRITAADALKVLRVAVGLETFDQPV